ncbi:hypothetical protein [Frankia sp. KB5]|uniref:hypothetical protein n=1 Tax=Frankia sp. KB5 TaxID=683318 RepID=UPI000A22A041|nr:hypothetical protein [Frankia sp. KB5]ORT53009.1 hypothetical protein KBI5_08890 [Frankia sp. KB5]
MTGPSPSETPPLRAFRLLRGQLLLDLPFHPYAGAEIRVATLWPDPRAPRGWASAYWEPAAYGARGFLAGAVDLGDVIGFTAEIHPPRALPTTSPTPRTDQPAVTRYLSWYGYLHEISDTALLLRGPYPHPLAAYTAAQHALIATLDQQHPGQEAALPASPPVTTSLTHTAEHTIVGDLHHGWIRVPTGRFTHALMHPPDQLRYHLTARAPGLLTGHEPPITLAALAAHHIPDYLSNPTPPPARLPHTDPLTPPTPTDTPPPPPPPTVPASPPSAPADNTSQSSTPPDATSPPREADHPITPADTTPQPATPPPPAPTPPAPDDPSTTTPQPTAPAPAPASPDTPDTPDTPTMDSTPPAGSAPPLTASTPEPAGPSDASAPATAPMDPAPFVDTVGPKPHTPDWSATPDPAPTGPGPGPHDPARGTPQPVPDPLPDPTPGIDLP